MIKKTESLTLEHCIYILHDMAYV